LIGVLLHIGRSEPATDRSGIEKHRSSGRT
jgi:hypothetical protein